jgi:DNA uptake protein ComE-like DNA-binding protein
LEVGLKLGLTEKQTNTILNAINKGYRFYDKEDFRKIYGIRQKQYEILSSYIKINTSKLNQYQRFTQEKDNKSFTEIDSLFEFDPNSASADDWKKLGFGEKQIATIQNYTAKGGKFKSAEDLKKIYGIKNEQYEKIKNYITISSAQKSKQINKKTIVDLNNAGVEMLKNYGGFWRYNAEKIVQYRTALGGFVDKSQLYELYGVKKEYVDKITDSIFIDLSRLTKIRINFASTDEFAKHPYLSGKNAQDITRFRDLNGPFTDLKKLKQNKIISESTYNQVYPYLSDK